MTEVDAPVKESGQVPSSVNAGVLAGTIDVSAWDVGGLETIGGEEKYWLIEPGNDVRWLFKPNNVHAATEKRPAWSQREDISEKVAADIATCMGVPCAEIRHARRDDQLGCISKNLTPKDWELQTGAVLLDALLDDYVPGKELRNKDRKGHSLVNIREALRGYAVPPDANLPPAFDAFDVFVGYVVLDAVIANRDRHDENWAVLRPPAEDQSPATLCGSFDHGRALGSTLTEAKMSVIVQDANLLNAWVEKGTAWRFEHETGQKPPTLVALAKSALSMVSTEVGEFWRQAVLRLNDDRVAQMTSYLAPVSEVTGTFIRQVVATNRRRVLDVYQ